MKDPTPDEAAAIVTALTLAFEDEPSTTARPMPATRSRWRDAGRDYAWTEGRAE